MIDIHSHILWGLDDGAETLEESKAMLRMAAECGTTDIVATPHANLEFTFQPNEIEDRLAELTALIAAPRLHYGCDFHLHHENIEDALAHPTKFTVNHKRYLLVEFSDLLILRNTDEILGELQAAGMIPIITHPERNPLLQVRLPLLSQWVEAGSLIQVTGHALLGHFGTTARKAAEELMRRGLVHFIASDAHDTRHRPPRLDDAFKYVRKSFGARLADLLFITNPMNVLTGDPAYGGVLDVEPERKWYHFWK